MRGRIGVLSAGIWRLRHLIRAVTDWEPVFLQHNQSVLDESIAAVAGWGQKPTANRARQLATAWNKPYIAIEDGFLRSVSPGRGELPLSLVFDTTGVHYDPTQTSDLEQLIAKAACTPRPDVEARAGAAIAHLRELGLSKYNAGPRLTPAQLDLGPAPRGGRVLVIDQTRDDASVLASGAKAATFAEMVHAAQHENPKAQIIVKTHPEAIGGCKQGYLPDVRCTGVHILGVDVNPWSLIDIVDHVYVVSSQLGLEALLGGRKVTCFGGPFYAGWGLTDDRIPIPRRQASPTIAQLFAAAYIDYARYIDPVRLQRMSLENAIDHLAWRRDMALSPASYRRAVIQGYRLAGRARAWLG